MQKKNKYMTAHLRRIHKISADEAVKLSKCNRAVKSGVIQKNTPVACPVKGCTAMVVRVDLHLRNQHKLDKDGEDYKRLVYYILLKWIKDFYRIYMQI